MKKNKKKIFAMLIFLLMSLIMFASANPAGLLSVDVEGIQLGKPSLDVDGQFSIEVFDEIPEFKAVAKDANGNELKVDITHSINNQVLGTYEVRFKAEDLDGNVMEEKRDFLVVDTTRPIISLRGRALVKRILGYEKYTDERARVTDNYDPTRIINGTVSGDPFAVGYYYLLYNAQDSSGNRARQVTRTIKMLAPGADEDGDGYTNEEEYNEGTDYDDPNDHPDWKWTITFDSDGGSVVPNLVVNHNQTATKPINPTKEGYIFVNWLLNDNPFDFNMRIKQNYNLKATWTAANDTKYKVNHYLENITDDNYTLLATEEKVGKTGDNTTSTVRTNTGFTPLAVTEKPIAADGSTVINVYYNRNLFKVTYKITGTIDPNDAYNVTDNVKFGTPLTELVKPTKAGYKFNGWTGFVAPMPNKDVEITGNYEIDENQKLFDYNINYFIENTTTVVPGITSPKTGKGFIGQVITITHPTTDQGYKVKADQPATVTVLEDNSASVTVYYELDETQWVTVDFSAGANGTIGAFTPVKVLKAYALDATQQPNEVEAPSTTANAGYKFNTWSPSFALSNVVTVDTTYVAQFIVDENQKLFDYNINYFIENTTTVVPGITSPVTGKGFIGEVITFTHPTTDQGYKVKADQPATVTVLEDNSASVTVYYELDETQWVTVNFSAGANGTIGAFTPVKVLKAYALDATQQPNSVVAPSTTANAGYKFSTWSPEFAITNVLTTDTTYIAQFIIDTSQTFGYTVKHFQKNVSPDSYVLSDTETLYGTIGSITIASAKTYDGFTPQTFTQGTIAADGSTVVEIYYNRNSYTIIFNSNGGTSVGSITKIYGESVTKPTNPTRTNYTFGEWYSNSGLTAVYTFTTMPAENITVYAKWTANQTGISAEIKDNAQLLFTKGTTYEIKDFINVYNVYADGTKTLTTDYSTDFTAAAVVNNKTLNITQNLFTNNILKYTVINEEAYQTKFEIKSASGSYRKTKWSRCTTDCDTSDKTSWVSKTTPFFEIIEHYAENIVVNKVSILYSGSSSYTQATVSDVVRWSRWTGGAKWDPVRIVDYNGSIIDRVAVSYTRSGHGDFVVVFKFDSATNTFTSIDEYLGTVVTNSASTNAIEPIMLNKSMNSFAPLNETIEEPDLINDDLISNTDTNSSLLNDDQEIDENTILVDETENYQEIDENILLEDETPNDQKPSEEETIDSNRLFEVILTEEEITEDLVE